MTIIIVINRYEKRAEFERDVRARNVTALHRSAPPKDEDELKSRKRQTNTVIEKPTEKAAKQEASAVKSWRERRDANKKAEVAEPEPERKSWREKLAEKQKEDEEKKIAEKKVADEAAKAAAEARKAAEESADATADTTADTTAAPPAEEEEDSYGTKKLKSDFNFMTSGLDAELEAGRSKLAKLRERIRKAKTAIKEADDCLAEEEKAKDAKREALREQMRKKAQEAKKK